MLEFSSPKNNADKPEYEDEEIEEMESAAKIPTYAECEYQTAFLHINS